VKSFPAFGILLRSPSRRRALFSLLEDNSGLPGPRANLELAYSFAKSVAATSIGEWQWELLLSMVGTSPAEAPVNSPKVYLAFCGLLALGTLYGEGIPRPRRRAALAALKRAASDPRWRIREGAAMGMQLIGEKDPQALRKIVEGWLPASSLWEMRAIAAALAHPPLLVDLEFALFSLDVAAKILASLARTGAKRRGGEDFRVLRQGLGYALSIYTAASPAEGFALLRKSASIHDHDIAWVVTQNLKKKRLSVRFPEEVRKVSLIASWGGEPSRPFRGPR
jgi:hypothetical protein